MFALSVCLVRRVVTGEMGRTGKNDNAAREQDRPLVVSAKEDAAFPVCSLCQGENY